MIPPAGSTASTWGRAAEELARLGRVITYDRRGYARSGGEVARSMSAHTADAAALLEHARAAPAVVVGTSAGAAIAVDLAVRRPELVRVVIAHEFPWRFSRRLPAASQVAALARIGWPALRGRHSDAAEALLRFAYTYRDGASAWDAFPEEWRRIGRENARAALADFRNSIAAYPSAADLASVRVPVVCTYGERSPASMVRLVEALAAAIPTAESRQIEGAGHAAPFDATDNFVQVIADSLSSQRRHGHEPSYLDRHHVSQGNDGLDQEPQLRRGHHAQHALSVPARARRVLPLGGGSDGPLQRADLRPGHPTLKESGCRSSAPG